MTATLAASAAILKTKYPGGELPTEAYENNTLLAMMPKATDFDGQNYVVALRTDTTAGASADFATALAAIAQSVYSRFTVTRVEDFAIARIKGQALKAAAKNTGALVDLWDSEMKSTSHTATRSLAVMAYRDGTGTRGFAVSGTGTTQITLGAVSSSGSVNDITNFALNMRVQAAATSGGALRGGYATITGIDRANSVLTSGSAWSTQIIGLQANDALLRAGDLNAVITGLAGWCPGGAAPGPLFGLTRSTDPVRLAGQLYNATTVPMQEALIEAAARVGVEGGRPSHVFMHPRDAANLKKSLDAKVQYNRVQSSVAGISFSAMELEGDNGTIKVLTDMNCPRSTAFMLQLDNWRLHSLGPAPQILDYDSNTFLRIASDDAYEVRLGSYLNVECNGPANQIQIQNFGA